MGEHTQFDSDRKIFESSRIISDQARKLFLRAQKASSNRDWQDSILLYSEVITHAPNLPQAYNNMGDAYKNMGNLDAALKCFNKAAACDPEIAAVHSNLGGIYHHQKEKNLAIKHFLRAIEIRPSDVNARIGLALIYKESGEFDKAHDCLDRAVSIAPDVAEARWNRAALLLLKGLYGLGWQDYESRFKIGQHRSIYPHDVTGQRWDGASSPGQTILVHDEQGLGDTIQFVRYLPLVKSCFKRVVFETRKEIVDLLGSNPGIDEIILRTSAPPPSTLYNQYIPLMSLPGVLNFRNEHLTGDIPYIRASHARSAYWKGQLSPERINVGLVWAGRPEHANDANRSCPFDSLTPLFQMDGISFVGLQKGPASRSADNCTHGHFFNWGNRLENFADTAGLLENLDLIVTVDTSVAHLAGAMGRPVWIMLPFVPDWRWAISGSRTPWYPTMRLFRQPCPNDWQSVVRDVKNSLRYFFQLS